MMIYVVDGCLDGIFPKYSFWNQVSSGDTAQIGLDGAISPRKLNFEEKEGSDRTENNIPSTNLRVCQYRHPG